MMISGVFGFFEGLAAIIRGSFFVVLPNYAYSLSATGWGWLHLILGVLRVHGGRGAAGGPSSGRCIAGVVLASFQNDSELRVPAVLPGLGDRGYRAQPCS